MQVQVEDRLPAVPVAVDHTAITSRRSPWPWHKPLRENELADQGSIALLKIIQGGDWLASE